MAAGVRVFLDNPGARGLIEILVAATWKRLEGNLDGLSGRMETLKRKHEEQGCMISGGASCGRFSIIGILFLRVEGREGGEKDRRISCSFRAMRSKELIGKSRRKGRGCKL